MIDRQTFVLDTSVLLHDPDALTAFGNNDVVIPLAVLEEIGDRKSFRGELPKNSREILQAFESLKKMGKGDFYQGIILPNGTRIRIQLEVNKKSHSSHFSISLSSTTHTILMTAYFLFESGERVVVVTKDLAMRVKAEAMGLKAQDYGKQKFSYEGLYKGYRKILLPKHEIDLFFKDGEVVPSSSENSFFPNEYCLMTAVEDSFAVGKYDLNRQKIVSLIESPESIWGIQPLNIKQRCAIDLLLRDEIKLITMIGPAGTGKTMLALAAGLRKVFDERIYKRILVSRPIIPLGRDIGYLPGMKDEKLSHWMQPIYDNLEYLCQSHDNAPNETLRWVMEGKKLEMEAVTYIRGRTLPKIYMIIDEAQNLTPHEVKTIISRAGQDTKVVLTGDPTQIDNPYLDKHSNGLTYLVECFKKEKIYGHIFMDKTERSELAALAAEIM
ncbi:MAG: PhoH family protein [Chlamydiales bacterium]